MANTDADAWLGLRTLDKPFDATATKYEWLWTWTGQYLLAAIFDVTALGWTRTASASDSPPCSGNKHRFALPPTGKLALNINTKMNIRKMQIQHLLFKYDIVQTYEMVKENYSINIMKSWERKV